MAVSNVVKVFMRKFLRFRSVVMLITLILVCSFVKETFKRNKPERSQEPELEKFEKFRPTEPRLKTKPKISPRPDLLWNQTPLDSIVNLVAHVDFVKCREPNPETDIILKLPKQDCALFCVGRGFSEVNVKLKTSECFCSNENSSMREANFDGCSTANHISSLFLSYRLTVRHYPQLQGTNNFLGCLKTNINNLQNKGIESISEKETKTACYEDCSKKQLSISISVVTLAKATMCYCAPNFLDFLYFIDMDQNISESSEKCKHGEVSATQWALENCRESVFLNPQAPVLPQIGLVTIPGSGNTWTRLLFQKLTGILSGSIYRSGDLVRKGLPGETETLTSGKTTMFKMHEGLQINDNENTKYYKTMAKFVHVFRNPLRSTLAEFNRRKYGHTISFRSEADFRKVAGSPPSKRYFSANFAQTYEQQTSRGLSILSAIFDDGKPVLVISYEDLQQNLLSQLLRILLFFDVGDVTSYWNRAICTYYNDAKAKEFKRNYKVDLEKVAAEFLNKQTFHDDLILFEKNFTRKGVHFLRMDEYMKSFQN